jgi:hypothetical protein
MPRPVGRPPMDSARKKGVQISVRLRQNTVQALTRAAKRHGIPLAAEMTYRLEDSLEREAEHPQLFGTKENSSFSMLLALSLKQLRVLTGHWWYEDPFTFRHAIVAAEMLFKYCKPEGRLEVPRDLPPPLTGHRRRASGGLPHKKSHFGAEATLELIEAMEAFSGGYGEKYKELSQLLPESQREEHLFSMEVYARMGRALMPLHEHKQRRQRVKPTS